MASEKKSKKQNIERRAEKLGEVEGKRRPYLGLLFLLLAIVLSAAFANYAPGQDVFFRESLLKDFIYSTDSTSANVCGRVGATFCLVFVSLIGLGLVLLLVYVFELAYLCFTKRARLIGWGRVLAMLLCLVSLTAMLGMFQMFKEGAIVSTEYFPSGWGGKLGSLLYADLLHPALRFFGSFILLSIIYAFCFVASFAESPLEVIREVCLSLRDAARGVGRFFLAFFGLFGRAFKSSGAEGERQLEPETQGELLKAKKPKRQSKKKIAELMEEEGLQSAEAEAASSLKSAEMSEDSEGEAEGKVGEDEAKPDDGEDDFYDGDGEFTMEKSPDAPEEGSSLDEVETKAGYKPVFRPLESVGEFVEDISASGDGGGDLESVGEGVGLIPENKPSKLKVSTVETEEYVAPKQRKTKGNYVFPSVELLNPPKRAEDFEPEDYDARMAQIIATLKTFKIGVTPAEAFAGPVVTRYEVHPNEGVRINKIAALEEDLALGLKVMKVRVTITGKGTVGIEVPNRVRQNVSMREILESKAWNEAKGDIPVVLGKDLTGKPVILDLAKMPHALIAGSTGSGKSVCINTIIASLLYRCTPEDLRTIMVDPKMVELQVYNSLPHQLVPVVTDPRKVPAALAWLIKEMMRRFALFQKMGVRNISGCNAKILKDKAEQEKAEELDALMTPEERAMSYSDEMKVDSADLEIPKAKLPYIVCIIDELADLMMVAGKEVEAGIARLAQLGRAAGIHLIVATQRPSTDVITGLIKANLPTRIGFKVASYIDSRTILDNKGAETLIGMGDMLFIPPGSSDLIRAQGAFLSDEEINGLVDALKVNGEPEFEDDIQQQLDAAGEDGGFGDDGDWNDSLAPQAIKIIKENNRASISLIQRKLGIGYPRAAALMDELEEKGIVGPNNGPSNPREILI